MAGWKYKQGGIGEQLVQRFPFDEAGEFGTGLAGLLFQRLGISVGVVGIARNSQAEAFSASPEAAKASTS